MIDYSFLEITATSKLLLSGRTKGLCGTFSGNQKDDFATPDGDVETGAIAFANKWKVNKDCIDSKNEPKNPCELNPQKRATAEEYCSKIHSDIFSRIYQYCYIL